MQNGLVTNKAALCSQNSEALYLSAAFWLLSDCLLKLQYYAKPDLLATACDHSKAIRFQPENDSDRESEAPSIFKKFGKVANKPKPAGQAITQSSKRFYIQEWEIQYHLASLSQRLPDILYYKQDSVYWVGLPALLGTACSLYNDLGWQFPEQYKEIVVPMVPIPELPLFPRWFGDV